MLLCEAQKIFGNRWTEIAKVVSGRTDNAVKNRFNTHCKKKAKHEALAKENITSYINLNNKRVILQHRLDTDSISDVSDPIKRLRSNISDVPGTGNTIESSVDDCANKNQPFRHPFAVLAQNFHIAGETTLSHRHANILKGTSENDSNKKSQGTFLKKNDPMINVLMQQAELLSSLALKVNLENTNQSFENAWKVLQEFLHQTNEGDILKFQLSEVNSGHDTHKNLITDLSSSKGIRPCKRQPALSEESGGSLEYSSGSTLLSQGNKTEESQVKAVHDQDIEFGLQNSQIADQTGVQELKNGIFCDLSVTHGTKNIIFWKNDYRVLIHSDYSTSMLNCFILIKMMTLVTADTLPVCDEMRANHGSATAECEYPKADFSSPIQVTPQFSSLAEAIPSPKFSESERQFLLKTLGGESTSPH